jgi:hypothetical protein
MISATLYSSGAVRGQQNGTQVGWQKQGMPDWTFAYCGYPDNGMEWKVFGYTTIW